MDDGVGYLATETLKSRSVSLKVTLPLVGESILEELAVAITLIIYADWLSDEANNGEIFPSSAPTSVYLSIPASPLHLPVALDVTYVTRPPLGAQRGSGTGAKKGVLHLPAVQVL